MGTARWPVGVGVGVEGATVLAAGVVAFLHLRDAFFFTHDDLPQFLVANDEGPGWELFGLNLFGHFGPVNRLGHLLFLRWADLDLTVGAIAATGLVVTLLLVVLWCCHELRLSPTRRALVVGWLGFSAALLDTAVWMDGALHILPALIATYAVIGAHLRGINTGAARWHVASVLLFAAGLLTQERPAFALPLIVLIDVLLVESGAPWRRRLALLRSVVVPLAVMAVIAGTAAALLLRFYAPTGGPGPPFDVLAQTVAGALTTALPSALLGWMPLAMPSVTTQVVSGLLILVVACLVVLRRRANVGPLLFVTLVFLLYYGFLAFSPLLTADNVPFNVLRMHNAVYVVVPAVLGLAHVRLSSAAPVVSAGIGRPRPDGARPRLRRWAGWLATAAVILVVALIATLYTDQRWVSARAVHAYVDAVAAGQKEWNRSDTTVLPLLAPVGGGWSVDYARHDTLLPLFLQGWTPGPLRERVVVLDDRGHIRPVIIGVEAEARLPALGTNGGPCLRTGPGSDRVSFPLDTVVTAPPLFVSIGYELDAEGTAAVPAEVASFDGEAWATRTRPVLFPAGRHTVVLPLTADPVMDVALTDLPHDISLCFTDVRVVRPLYETDGACFAMDELGAVLSRTDCPVVEQGP